MTPLTLESEQLLAALRAMLATAPTPFHPSAYVKVVERTLEDIEAAARAEAAASAADEVAAFRERVLDVIGNTALFDADARTMADAADSFRTRAMSRVKALAAQPQEAPEYCLADCGCAGGQVSEVCLFQPSCSRCRSRIGDEDPEMMGSEEDE